MVKVYGSCAQGGCFPAYLSWKTLLTLPRSFWQTWFPDGCWDLSSFYQLLSTEKGGKKFLRSGTVLKGTHGDAKQVFHSGESTSTLWDILKLSQHMLFLLGRDSLFMQKILPSRDNLLLGKCCSLWNHQLNFQCSLCFPGGCVPVRWP